MTNVAIRATHLSKVFRIGKSAGKSHYRTLRESLAEAGLSPFRKGWLNSTQEFQALKNIQFEIEPGEVVGVIGRNGAGKSTLLKILSGITPPTTGRVELRGRIGSLLEVGTGFHPELTGRENIYLNGSILGMRHSEVQTKFDKIVDFSGVEQFLETPVKRYSSGMRVRLAFSVAAFLEPEILIIDEVLAVGDSAFQRKCLGTMNAVARSGRTVIFVSHNLAAVDTLCNRGLLLEQGELLFDGATNDAIRHYRRSVDNDGSTPNLFPIELTQTTVHHFSIATDTECPARRVEFRSPFQLHLNLEIRRESRDLHLLLILWRRSDRVRISSLTTRELPHGPISRGAHQFVFDVQGNSLMPDLYDWTLTVVDQDGIVDQVENICSMEVTESIIDGASHPFTSAHGVCNLETSVTSLPEINDDPLRGREGHLLPS